MDGLKWIFSLCGGYESSIFYARPYSQSGISTSIWLHDLIIEVGDLEPMELLMTLSKAI